MSGPTSAPTRSPTRGPTRVDFPCCRPFKDSHESSHETSHEGAHGGAHESVQSSGRGSPVLLSPVLLVGQRKFSAGRPGGHPTKNFGQAPPNPENNKHFGTDMPRGRPRKNFGLKDFGLIFRSLNFVVIQSLQRLHSMTLSGAWPPRALRPLTQHLTRSGEL